MTSDQYMELVRGLGNIEGKLDQALTSSIEHRKTMDDRVTKLEGHVDELRISKAKVIGIGTVVSLIITAVGWWIHG